MAYEWLVVSGARAQYKGVGQINRTGDYGFLLTAVDSPINGGGDADAFRIKIWDRQDNDRIVYDNQLGASDTSSAARALGGGSIVIHDNTKKGERVGGSSEGGPRGTKAAPEAGARLSGRA